MEGISDIRISGIDETRPPRIRKEYVARIQAQARQDAANSAGKPEDEGEQGRLNRIIAGLKFED
jgi:hypothetical protein